MKKKLDAINVVIKVKEDYILAEEIMAVWAEPYTTDEGIQGPNSFTIYGRTCHRMPFTFDSPEELMPAYGRLTEDWLNYMVHNQEKAVLRVGQRRVWFRSDCVALLLPRYLHHEFAIDIVLKTRAALVLGFPSEEERDRELADLADQWNFGIEIERS